jgi:hypothetical protein
LGDFLRSLAFDPHRVDWDIECENCEEALRLKRILAQLRIQLQNERQSALQRMETDIANAKILIERAVEEGQAAIQQENRDEERWTFEFHQTYMSLKSQCHAARTQAEKDAESLDIELGKVFREYAAGLKRNMATKTKLIATSKRDLDDLILKLKADRSAELNRLESVLSTCCSENERNIEETKISAQQELTQLETEIAAAATRRDAAITLWNTRGPRKEEEELIARLDCQCNIVTGQLSTFARDLMLYRGRIQTQESEYNERFGASPQIAILKRDTRPGRHPTKAPLPPLHNSVKY